ncbi:sigma-E processing peptidase SpoIIGA [Bacillus benzoevorans]|uniref:Sporulation sigma-E factor-processing peptidase n=1 Tax=Bacillus benzoevorans TaxID=1456 RepID=A0A7X0HN33_9BACI|nr:sigma-E processing peptidase SpoIIGA [Bacillus benzoevorans]MBB6443754.1 stage II sporulation protein GA (sporulation sigma-E factor processing peptidase) [Bacillus benzoevorans]
MAVYLDIIWLLNFMFDSLLLYLTAVILKRKFRYWRLFAGGMIGSLIILLSVTPLNVYAGNPIVKFLFSILMVFTAFGYKRFKYFVNGLLLFYFITFLVGGTLIGVHYFMQFDMNLSSSVFLASVKGFGDPVSWLFVIIGFPLAWHFSKNHFEKMEVAKIQHNQLISLDISIEGKTFRFTGLVDSGNQLYDPISKMPVMFVSVNKMVEELPEMIRTIALSSEEMIMGDQSIAPEWENRMRIIPFKVMGQEHQLIIALKPDNITIYQNEETIIVDKGLVSFTMQQLSSDDAFQCIVHPKMLNGIKQEKAG